MYPYLRTIYVHSASGQGVTTKIKFMKEGVNKSLSYPVKRGNFKVRSFPMQDARLIILDAHRQ